MKRFLLFSPQRTSKAKSFWTLLSSPSPKIVMPNIFGPKYLVSEVFFCSIGKTIAKRFHCLKTVHLAHEMPCIEKGFGDWRDC